jgi:hypothetical protein
MIRSKILALSLLSISSLALAHVQLHIQLELENAKQLSNHSINTTVQFDEHESLEIYNQGGAKVVVAELLVQEEATATVSFTLYGKNNAGEYETISAPVLVLNYTDPAVFSQSSTNGETIKMTVQAQKV